MQLLSTESMVESPFIIAKIGGYTFGSYTGKSEATVIGSTLRVTYPNYMRSLNVTKINGQVNTYTLNLVYQITENDDPNMMEQIFSNVRDERTITLTYGDWNSPANIYREESMLITDVRSNFQISQSKIEYTIKGVSNDILLKSALYDFPARNAKPSDIIKELLYNPSYGLLDIFPGMSNKKKVSDMGLIASDDKKVNIDAVNSINAYNYINYLTQYMSSNSNAPNDIIKDSTYRFCTMNDTNNTMGGAYFSIRKIGTSVDNNLSNEPWEIDIGYPGKNFVTDFNVDNDESWALLYNYGNKINQSNYVYSINDDGNIVTEYSPSIARSKKSKVTTERNKTWWTQMTQYPIKATLTLKGLVRPTILMDYIKLNVLLYGKKHITSGIYVITEQSDSVSSAGYRTTLKLLRVEGDN